MKVTVLGKERISGIGKKSGNPFDNSVVYVSYRKNGVEGVSCEQLWLQSVSYPLDDIIVGSTYDLDRNNGFINSFDLVD